MFDQSSPSNVVKFQRCDTAWIYFPNFKNKRENGRIEKGGRRMDVKMREGEDPDHNRVPLFDLLFSYLSYYNLYGS